MGVSGVVCIKCSLCKYLAVLEYKFFKMLVKQEEDLT